MLSLVECDDLNAIKNTPNVNLHDYINGLTFMNTETVKYFIEHDCDITEANGFIYRKYLYNTELSKYLLNKGILKLNTEFVIRVMLSCNVDLLDYIMGMYELENDVDYFNCAVLSGNLDIVKCVIAHNIMPTYSGFIKACNNRHKHIMRYLIEDHSVKVNRLMVESINYYERESRNKDFLHLVYRNRDYNDDSNLLYIACHLGDVDKIRELMSVYGCDVNRTDDYKVLPIQYALFSGNTECVMYLMNELKANTEPLTVYDVIRSNNIEIIKHLIDFDKLNPSIGYYVMEAVINTDNVDIMEYFINNGFHVVYLSLEYAAATNKLNAFKYIEETRGIRSYQLNALIQNGFYGNIDVIKYVNSKYILTDDDLYKCLHGLVYSDDNIESFKYIVDIIGNNDVIKQKISTTIYTQAANTNAYKICEYIREYRQ